MPTDEELIARVAAGDREAFSSLYDRFAARIFGLALYFLEIRADAEDVLQETFLQIWDHAHRYNPALCAASGWVLMLARSRAVDRVRRLRKTPAPLPADLAAAEPAGGSVVDRVDAGEPIAEALKELPPPQQDVIRLSFYTGLTHEEIAAKLGLPLGTVKTRIRLGMTRLRDRLSARNKVTDE